MMKNGGLNPEGPTRCAHHAGEQFDKDLISGLSRAVADFASLPGALSIARNGGSELTLGRLLLGAVERETQSFAFTETSEQLDRKTKRHDHVVRCARCGTVAVIELKHNLAHKRQMGSIVKEKNAVHSKLRRLAAQHPNIGYYYVHFIFELGAQPGSVLAELHNSHRTAYKQFQDEQDLQGLRSEICAANLLGTPSCASPEIKHPADERAFARLHCWVFKLNRAGEFQRMVAG